jgi:hypothetical protein
MELAEARALVQDKTGKEITVRHLERTQVHPFLLREDHERPSSSSAGGPYRAEDGLMTGEQERSPCARTYTSSRTPNDI